MKHLLTTLILGAGLLAAGIASADVTERSNATALWFDGGQEMKNATLSITGPDGFASQVSAGTGLPAFRLQGAGRLSDGLYQYVLVAATNEMIKVDSALDNGRGDAARSEMAKPFSMYGAFRISRGTIVPGGEGETGSDQDPVE